MARGVVGWAWRVLMGLFALIGVISLAKMLVSQADPYVDSVSGRLASPNGQSIAAVVHTTGGATVSISRVVVSRSTNGDARVLLRDGVIVLEYRDQDFLNPDMRWIGDNRLHIDLPCAAYSHAANAADFVAEGNIKRIAIEFRQSEPDCALERTS